MRKYTDDQFVVTKNANQSSYTCDVFMMWLELLHWPYNIDHLLLFTFN